MNDDAINDKIAALSPFELADLERQGVLMFNREYSAYFPNWQVVTHVTRTQVFPAGATITVEHSYVPDTGGSVGGTLYPAVRQEFPESLAQYKAAYCIDDQFLAGFDKRVMAASEEERWGFSETWIGYVPEIRRELVRSDCGFPTGRGQGAAGQSGQFLHGWRGHQNLSHAI